jgi:uncharacterized membrane protein YhaH (DUF805 family)
LNWREFLFSFRGRASRGQYWVMSMLTVPFLVGAALIDLRAVNGDPEKLTLLGPGDWLYLVILWPFLAVSARRWHDRNKSGWWTLMLLPALFFDVSATSVWSIIILALVLIGALWVTVENGMLRGTVGDNRFGPDPAAPKA